MSEQQSSESSTRVEEKDEGSDEGDEGSNDSDKDEEELIEMLFTLQKVYNDVCSPTPKASQSPRTHSKSPPKNMSRETTLSPSPAPDDWEESDGEAMPSTVSSSASSGCGMSGCDAGGDGSEVFDRLETTRATLEDTMGLSKLLAAYNMIQVHLHKHILNDLCLS